MTTEADRACCPSQANPAGEVDCTRSAHWIEHGRCRFCAKTPERIEAEIREAPRRSALT